RGRTCVDGPLGLKRCNRRALAGDARDDGHAALGRVDEGSDDLRLLLLREEGALTGVAEHDEALDAVDRAEPAAEAGDGVEVDRALAGERGDRCGGESPKVESHGGAPLFIECRDLHRGGLCRSRQMQTFARTIAVCTTERMVSRLN